MFSPFCKDTARFVGYEICFSDPGGSFETNTTATLDPGASHTTPVPVPTNAIPGSKPCGKWHSISPGDECGKVALANGITLEDFYYLNPKLNTKCTNLLLDIAYCVAAVGDISTYSDYPTPIRNDLDSPLFSVSTSISRVSRC
ncbi:uncharacterized protein PODANS_4_5600 [Podospora anserina S mat+]|uniref:Podospora anserina S mat+ genomic DNA chromosome 4, supercontig 4 n=1 Tax=Podospora anserina (strain S / ATCC MYA-4624 / DSM 980 / FGSC 10383) TaxID=515849 RepID=B2AQ20_PODAN|nr:uncharacterized protein PODANS_4_5600 [Podospora anserina S mat+]CAP66959.1 unnamed protein product [Podospora anserina S mat+]CDP28701.1 Putative protein of unknown function [Podospora anserina S mat+]